MLATASIGRMRSRRPASTTLGPVVFSQLVGGLDAVRAPTHVSRATCPVRRRLVPQDEAQDEASLEVAQGETILVIDDEEPIRMLIPDVLEEAGYRVLTAKDGPGLKILQSDARADLLIIDGGLPGGMNGRQVADAARTTRAALKVLFVTG